MYLQLAEAYKPPTQYMAEPRRIRVRSYWRGANYVPAHYRSLSEWGGFQEEKNPYVFIPDPSGQSQGIMIREDYFDFLTPVEWKILMQQLAPFQPPVVARQMSEFAFLAARGERRRLRRERKRLKLDKRAAKNELIKARAKAKAEGRGAEVLGSIIEGVTSIFGKEEAPEVPTPLPAPEPKPMKILGMPPMTAALLGVGAVVIGAMVLRRKK